MYNETLTAAAAGLAVPCALWLTGVTASWSLERLFWVGAVLPALMGSTLLR